MPLLKKHTIRLGEQAVHMGEQFGSANAPEVAEAVLERADDNQIVQEVVSAVEVYAPPIPTVPVVDEDERQRVLQNIREEGKTQAEAMAAEIKKKAEEEARTLLDTASNKAKELLEAETAKGIEQGKKEIYAQLRKHIEEAQDVVRQARNQKNAIIKSAVPEILRLSTRIAAQVVRNELTQNQNIVMDIVKDAIEKISDNEQVVIKVSAQDLQNVRNEKDLIIDLVEAKNLSIVPDKHCAEGGCVIETKLGFIDAKVVTKLDMIQTALLDVHHEEKTKRETTLKEAVERGEDIDMAAEEQKDIDELMKETSLEEIKAQEKKMLEEQQERDKANEGNSVDKSLEL
ncbi:flagellar assembly protein FliH [Candidatus Termititenax persephonae]|uniref:Flagellar assembly protein FliH n=1 Tax=Candidatus Termititenax persephonae TaxID=2218525 RepID=A0A388TFP0_9BACT|nr:flagellar assembly protein FliH [Candidatus Termititenax persephonae]